MSEKVGGEVVVNRKLISRARGNVEKGEAKSSEWNQREENVLCKKEKKKRKWIPTSSTHHPIAIPLQQL